MADDYMGYLHLATSIVALITGPLVLSIRKGTRRHIRIGYVYVGSMIMVNVTAFLIYRLFGGFGPFHVAAIFSMATVIAGMIPVIRRKPEGRWLYMHLSFMYWSVIGLYCAFFAELLTRIPRTPFFGMVGVATTATFFVGWIGFVRFRRDWAKHAPGRGVSTP